VIEVAGYPKDIAFEPKYIRHESAGFRFVPSFAPTKGRA